jgi:hypothetical protein
MADLLQGFYNGFFTGLFIGIGSYFANWFGRNKIEKHLNGFDKKIKRILRRS